MEPRYQTRKDVGVMEQVSELAYNAATRYFNALSKLGYLKQGTVDGFLILCFIDELFHWFPYDITEKDYTIIMRALECLGMKDCLIDLPTYEAYVDTLAKARPPKPRITEDSVLRISTSDITRIVN